MDFGKIVGTAPVSKLNDYLCNPEMHCKLIQNKAKPLRQGEKSLNYESVYYTHIQYKLHEVMRKYN